MFKPPVVRVVAALLGVAIACIDLFANRGELSPGAILLLLAGAGAVVTVMRGRFSIVLTTSVALWLPAIHLVLHALGRRTTLRPDTTLSILVVGAVACGAAVAGGLVAAALRRGARA
jgi:hypothetical protein